MDRPASGPLTGLVRDMVRTGVGLVVGYLVAHGIAQEDAASLGSALSNLADSVVVIVTSGVLAYLGKLARDAAAKAEGAGPVASTVAKVV